MKAFLAWLQLAGIEDPYRLLAAYSLEKSYADVTDEERFTAKRKFYLRFVVPLISRLHAEYMRSEG